MRNSTYFRMFIAMAIIVFISFLLLGALSTVLSYRRTMSERRELMTQAIGEAARYVEIQHLNNGLELDDIDVSVQLNMISRITGLDMLLADANMVIMASSEQSLTVLGSYVTEDYLRTLESDNKFTIAITDTHNLPSARHQITGMTLAMSVGGEMRPYAYLFASSDMSVSGREWRNFSTAFTLLALSVMTLTLVISFIATKRQTAPLNEMASAARRFAYGEYDVRVKETADRYDEIEQLAKAFNFMAESIQHNEELRRDFIANLSHELKTPMTVIAGFAEGLLDGTIPQKDAAHYLEIISSETRRLSRLVRSMLNLSMLGEATAESMLESSFDISEVVCRALLSLDGRINKKNLEVEAELPEEPIFTRGNKDSIYQVVYNLIDNAVKYSAPGTTIKIELWQQDKQVFVSIANHGETLSSEELPYIFQRFHKIDKSRGVDREGVGLGLYIVKTILDKHNEDIFVTSSDGETKFIFSLTLA